MSWHQATVGDACVATLQVDPARSGKQSFRYVDISGVDRDVKTISRADEIPSNEAPSRARKVIAASDILVSTVRPNLNAVAIVPEELDGEIASTGFTVLRTNEKLLVPKFLYYWVQHKQFVEFLVANATGASYPAVSDSIVKRAPLPLPPPSEQSRIVELLDQADALRRLRRVADAKAANILPALFLKMFGDPASNPMGWAVKAVGDVLTSADYGSSTRASDDGKGLPLIRMGNVSYEGNLLLDDLKFVELSDADAKKYRLEEDDILFNRTNSLDLVGKTGIWGGEMDAVVASYFIRIRVDREMIEPVFLWAYMNCSYMKRVLRATARGAIGQANINTNELRAFPLYLPPLEKQQEFVRKVGAIKESLPTATDKSDLNYLFEVLQRRAFSGELTAKWRQAHMTELLTEMQQQAKALNLPLAGNAA